MDFVVADRLVSLWLVLLVLLLSMAVGMGLAYLMIRFIVGRTQSAHADALSSAKYNDSSSLLLLLEAIPMGVSLYDPTGRRVLINTAGKQIVQNDRVDVPLEDLTAIYQIYEGNGDRPYPTEQLPLVRALQGEIGYADDMEIEVEGRRIPLEVRAVPILDGNQEVLWALVTFQDLSERRATEHLRSQYERALYRQVTEQTAALETSRAELQAVLDKVLAVILRLRLYPNRTVTYDMISQRCEELFGYTAAEFTAAEFIDDFTGGKTNTLWRSRIHPDDLEQVVAPMIEAVIQNRQSSEQTIEYRFCRKDGTFCWILANGIYTWNQDGEYWNATVVETDITDRKQAELGLQESESRFQMIAKTISQLVFLRSATTGEFIYVSPAYETIWGKPCESLYADSSSWMESIHPDDRAKINQSVHHQFQGADDSITREYRIIRPDGEVRWIFAQVKPVYDDSGHPTVFTGFAADISDRKQAELHLQHAVAENEALLQEIQHRVKNNLQLMISMLNMQQRRVTHPETLEKLRDCSSRIRVISLVQDLLHQSHNQVEVNLDRYVSMLVRQVATTHTAIAPDLTFDLQLQPVTVSSKVASVCGLILNELLTNTLKYAFPERLDGDRPDSQTPDSQAPDSSSLPSDRSPPSPHSPQITIQMGERRDQQPDVNEAQQEKFVDSNAFLQPNAPIIELVVADNGIGLPDDFDIDLNRNLGLLLVRSFVEQLNGTLVIEPHLGTQFRICFPNV
ncbi:MAG: PAS domain-containing protein [Elainellaceae cyanobacterium]